MLILFHYILKLFLYQHRFVPRNLGLMKYAENYGVNRPSRKYSKSRSYIYFWKSQWVEVWGHSGFGGTKGKKREGEYVIKGMDAFD